MCVLCVCVYITHLWVRASDEPEAMGVLPGLGVLEGVVVVWLESSISPISAEACQSSLRNKYNMIRTLHYASERERDLAGGFVGFLVFFVSNF